MNQRFGDQGLEILGIAFVQGDEKGRRELSQFLDRRGVVWPNAPTAPHWYAPPFEGYDVRYIPFNVLLDRDGRVLAVDLRGEALAGAVERALGRDEGT